MASRHQRRKKAARTKATAQANAFISEAYSARDNLIRSNKGAKPSLEERVWMKQRSSAVLCSTGYNGTGAGNGIDKSIGFYNPKDKARIAKRKVDGDIT